MAVSCYTSKAAFRHNRIQLYTSWSHPFDYLPKWPAGVAKLNYSGPRIARAFTRLPNDAEYN